ncbi:MAG: hypothetical protein AB7G87_01075 [Clostridia bacterium]
MFIPLSLEQANLKEVNGWKVGQKVQVKEYPGTWEIEGYHQYGGSDNNKYTTVYLAKLKKDGTKNGKGIDTQIENILLLGAAQPDKDKNGLTASEYAQQIFVSGFGKSDWYNTDKQSLVKINSISKTGRVKVVDIRVKKGLKPRVEKMVSGRKTYSQEESLLNLANLEYEIIDREQIYSPRLAGGEWKYWNGRQYISEPTLKLTWLLD